MVWFEPSASSQNLTAFRTAPTLSAFRIWQFIETSVGCWMGVSISEQNILRNSAKIRIFVLNRIATIWLLRCWRVSKWETISICSSQLRMWYPKQSSTMNFWEILRIWKLLLRAPFQEKPGNLIKLSAASKKSWNRGGRQLLLLSPKWQKPFCVAYFMNSKWAESRNGSLHLNLTKSLKLW